MSMDLKNQETVEPDKNGLFTVVMKNSFSPSSDPLELECIFSQAGTVQDVSITPKFTFLRYATSREALKALLLFGKEYNLSVAKISQKFKKNTIELNELHHQVVSDKRKTEHNPISGRYESTQCNRSVNSSEKVYLFVDNIESEDQFKELVTPYQPVSVRIVSKENHIFAYLTMRTEDNAAKMIQELNEKLQDTKKLHVTYDRKKSKKNSVDEDCQSVGSNKSSEKVCLFVDNIENEDHFNELVNPYEPLSINIVNKDKKRFAYLTMKSEDRAAKMIQELNEKLQVTKKLHVTYNRKKKNQKNALDEHCQSVGTINSVQKVSLFVDNIESEDGFKELIKSYQPVSFKIVPKDNKIFAYIKMKTEVAAAKVIEELNDKLQETKRLYVTYDRRQKGHKKVDDDCQSVDSFTSSEKVSLFVDNIENEDQFKELVEPYQPVSVKVIQKGKKRFAYLTMKNNSSASKMIKELDEKLQETKKLYVTYDRKQNKKKSMGEDCHSVGSVRSSEKKFLSAENIECKEQFQEIVKPNQPFPDKITKKNNKIEESAAKIIDEQNDKLWKTKKLQGSYKKKQKPVNEDCLSVESGSSNPPSESSMKKYDRSLNSAIDKTQPIPSLPESDFAGMPKLISESEVPNLQQYQLDWCIMVENFPPLTLESTLRNTFAKYHVLDMCFENNNDSHGCTKAVLYLARMYDVINAISDMNGFELQGHPLRVDVPHSYPFQRKIVLHAIEREKERAE